VVGSGAGTGSFALAQAKFAVKHPQHTTNL